MKTKTYTVVSRAGANIRRQPSGSIPTANPYRKAGYLETLEVIPDWTALNNVGGDTTYLPVMDGGVLNYVCADLVKELSHAEGAALAAPYVYQKIYDLKALHESASKVVSLSTLEEHKRISCNRAASIVLQLAGVLPIGKVIGHTDADGKGGATKTTMPKSVTGYQNLIPGTYEMIRANKLFSQLTPEHQKAGVVYIQDSNVCVSAGGGKIYSCNQTGKRYGEGGKAVLRNSGYPFTTKILYIIVPK